MFCSKCGTKIDEGGTSCANCGFSPTIDNKMVVGTPKTLLSHVNITKGLVFCKQRLTLIVISLFGLVNLGMPSEQLTFLPASYFYKTYGTTHHLYRVWVTFDFFYIAPLIVTLIICLFGDKAKPLGRLRFMTALMGVIIIIRFIVAYDPHGYGADLATVDYLLGFYLVLVIGIGICLFSLFRKGGFSKEHG